MQAHEQKFHNVHLPGGGFAWIQTEPIAAIPVRLKFPDGSTKAVSVGTVPRIGEKVDVVETGSFRVAEVEHAVNLAAAYPFPRLR